MSDFKIPVEFRSMGTLATGPLTTVVQVREAMRLYINKEGENALVSVRQASQRWAMAARRVGSNFNILLDGMVKDGDASIWSDGMRQYIVSPQLFQTIAEIIELNKSMNTSEGTMSHPVDMQSILRDYARDWADKRASR